MISRSLALQGSPPLRKVLFVLIVDAVTSVTLIAWEHAHRLRQKARS